MSYELLCTQEPVNLTSRLLASSVHVGNKSHAIQLQLPDALPDLKSLLPTQPPSVIVQNFSSMFACVHELCVAFLPALQLPVCHHTLFCSVAQLLYIILHNAM